MSLLEALFGPSKKEIWRQLAERVGGRFIDGGFTGADVVQVRAGDWINTLDTYSDGDVTFTRLRAPYVNPEGFSFTIYRSGFFSGSGKITSLMSSMSREMSTTSIERMPSTCVRLFVVLPTP